MTTRLMDRRAFGQAVALGLGAAALPVWAQGRKNVQIGHTGITWPGGNIPVARPQSAAAAAPGTPAAASPRAAGDPGLAPPPPAIRPVNAEAIEQIFRDVSSLGFAGLELFGWQVEGMEANGGVGRFVEKYRLPLVSCYSGPNLTDPAQRTSSIQRMLETAAVVKKHGGKIIVFGPNGVNRANFVFADHKADIITTLNEGAKAITDLGLTAVLHQHTGTCIETRDETYAVMEAVDTRYLKFGPDIGQLQKGGSDPVQVVKDFLPLIHHLHMKDYVGGEAFAGYCPLGQGKVDLAGVVDLLESSGNDLMIMAELDPSPKMPRSPLEAAAIDKAALQKLGYGFRA